MKSVNITTESLRTRWMFALLASLLLSFNTSTADEAVDFNRDIRPILSDKCYSCHGPDAKALQGGLRLDSIESATMVLESGNRAIVPGDSAKSTLIQRVTADDDSVRMPPAENHKELSTHEIELLQKWIEEGAKYQSHWSFSPPHKVTPPEVADPIWNRNPIDRFVFDRLRRSEMSPSREASRETLIRRLSLDLRGIPPTIEEVDFFLNDKSENAYEMLVDRMLESPRYGERMAQVWLDLARYGDTNGYHNDSERPVWLWRDWVIQAYNANMPFDQFSIWQLSGDLMPGASTEQKVASGFNRNCRFNEEGGADPEEFLTAYAADRTITMGRVWLGMTLNCAQCHSHKYDPVSQKEFYQLTAFFNSMEELGAGGESGYHNKVVPPMIYVQTAEIREEVALKQHRLDEIEREIGMLTDEQAYLDPGFDGDPAASVKVSQLAWEKSIVDFKPPAPPQPFAHWDFRKGPEDLVGDLDGELHGDAKITADGLLLDGVQAHFTSPAVGKAFKAKTLEAWVKLDNLGQSGGAVLGVQSLDANPGSIEFDAIVFGEREPARWIAGSDYFERTADLYGPIEKEADKKFVQLVVVYREDGSIQFFRNGLPYGEPYRKGTLHEFAPNEFRFVVGARALPPGSNFMLKGIVQEAKVYDRALADSEISATAGTTVLDVPDDIVNLLKKAIADRTPDENTRVRRHYLRYVNETTRKRLAALEEEGRQLRERLSFLSDEKNYPQQIVSVELPEPKPAYILSRGDFQAPGELVERKTPAFLPTFPDNLPRNRLGFAQWLMQPDQPLVARVQVNRFWQMLFGVGFVRTHGDFGLQGEYPSHPELLDYLAVEFVESGWNTKSLLKLIVMSQTYRQDSNDTRRFAQQDPENRLLWRASRVRLPAEFVRDNALAIAGVLSDKIGGPPSYPYQPSDFYRGKQNGWVWNTSAGSDLYRRGIYTFWRRTTPYPTFVIFDAPDRAECAFERPRTNTPLQALATLNDPQFIEAARLFAERLLTNDSIDKDSRIEFAFRVALSRHPTDREKAIMESFVSEQRAYYKSNRSIARDIAKINGKRMLEDVDPVELAVWTAFANMLLNLDETITRN